jgi:hypothetical protein
MIAKIALGVFAAALLSAPSFAKPDPDTKEGIEFFEKRIRPVLVDKCYSCHSADAEKLKGGLLLDTREGIRRGGDTGPAVVPGDEKESLLLTAIRYGDRDFEMPPKERLPASVVEDFAQWIKMGAPDPREGKAAVSTTTIDIEEGRKHWAFQPIVSPPVPKVQDEVWPRTDIDRFILAGLEAKGLRPVADAQPHELLRRINFDLTGLPGQSAADDPRAAIDALLASPRFGERWARRWLDVARYAESTGSAHNVMFPLAFRYRDWVIDALNTDMPYDQFIREQIAGDLLPAKDDAERNRQLVATGFLGVGIKDLRENDHHRFRMAMADEMIDATGRAFLGLTIACAKCHDHKFDPIPTRDYYALAGIFTSSEPLLGVRRSRQRSAFAASVMPLAGSGFEIEDADATALLKARVDWTYARLKVRDAKYAVLGTSTKFDRNPNSAQAKMLAEHPDVRAADEVAVAIGREVEALLKRFNTALPKSAMAMRDVKPEDVAVHIRGEDTQLGEIAPRGFPQVLTTADTKPVNRAQSGRIELAEWIASERNPLTARVMVNRLWQHLMGAGLVETPDDFGKTGQAPSDAALLDHLARRFIAQGWSVKKMIAEIMESRVYRLSSAHDAKALEADPANRLRWRMDRRRLDSDAISDAIRHISGELIPDRPSPQVALAPDSDDRLKSMDRIAWFAPTLQHRTIYQPMLRGYIPEDWSVFDFPDPDLVTGRRGVTTVPTQALYLMNSPFIAEQSAKTAAKLAARSNGPDALIREAYALIFNRAPSDDETRDAAAFLASIDFASGAAVLCQTLFASAEFRYLY